MHLRGGDEKGKQQHLILALNKGEYKKRQRHMRALPFS
jgi:hypothetical protein